MTSEEKGLWRKGSSLTSLKNSRFAHIDAARAMAICLALLSHGMMHFYGLLQNDDLLYAWIKSMTRSATPTFIIIFGMMLETVYLRKALDNWQGARKRLIQRSCQCYLGYVLTVMASFLGGAKSLSSTVSALFMLSGPYFGGILKFYSVALLLAIPILYWRMKRGVGVIFLAFALVGLASWGLTFAPAMHFPGNFIGNAICRIAGFLVGYGNRGGHPSVLHGFVFVLTGMLLGTQPFLRLFVLPARRKLTLAALALLTVVSIMILAGDIGDIWMRYVGQYYRYSNHINYFTLGSLQAISVILLWSVLLPPGKNLTAAARKIFLFGQYSLVSFTAGSVLLSLNPYPPRASDSLAAAGASLLYVLLVWFLVFIWDRRIRNDLERKVAIVSGD